MAGEVLGPLAARYAHWLGLDRAEVELDREEAAADIRAMQLIVRMERAQPPSWHAALALAAGGAAALCLDARSDPGGEWHESVAAYCRGHIRKVTRRARAGQWTATADLPGLTLTEGVTQIRTLVPGRVAELDRRITVLQVGGTDVEVDPAPDDPPTPRLTVFVPSALGMTLGKGMAQAGHAGMIAAALLAGSDQAALQRWHDAGCAAVMHRADEDTWAALRSELDDPERAWTQRRLLAVRDAGFTEVAPGTITVIATLEG